MMRLSFEGPTAGLIVIAPEAAFCNDCAWQYTCAAEGRCERRDRQAVRAQKRDHGVGGFLPGVYTLGALTRAGWGGCPAPIITKRPSHPLRIDRNVDLFPETTPRWFVGADAA